VVATDHLLAYNLPRNITEKHRKSLPSSEAKGKLPCISVGFRGKKFPL